MKIDKEDFDKLKQLDRIEYRQKKIAIEKEHQLGSLIPYYICFFIVSVISGVGCIIVKDITGESSIGLIKVFDMSISFLIIFLVVIIVFEGFNIFLWIKKMQELQTEYFNAEVKKK